MGLGSELEPGRLPVRTTNYLPSLRAASCWLLPVSSRRTYGLWPAINAPMNMPLLPDDRSNESLSDGEAMLYGPDACPMVL